MKDPDTYDDRDALMRAVITALAVILAIITASTATIIAAIVWWRRDRATMYENGRIDGMPVGARDYDRGYHRQHLPGDRSD